MEGSIKMTHRVLSVDERSLTQPARRAFMEEYLHEGYEFVEPESFDDATLREEAASACALTTGFAPITRELMEAGPDIKVVGKVGTGVDNIDVAAATELGIPVANAPGSMRCVPVAEHAMTLTLIMARRPWLWPTGERRLHFQLQGATLGIVGLGNIGQALARRAAAFEMEICAYTRTRGKFKPVGFEVEEVETLGDLLPRADFVALTLPLTPESTGLIGERELRTHEGYGVSHQRLARPPRGFRRAHRRHTRGKNRRRGPRRDRAGPSSRRDIPSTIFPTW